MTLTTATPAISTADRILAMSDEELAEHVKFDAPDFINPLAIVPIDVVRQVRVLYARLSEILKGDLATVLAEAHAVLMAHDEVVRNCGDEASQLIDDATGSQRLYDLLHVLVEWGMVALDGFHSMTPEGRESYIKTMDEAGITPPAPFKV
jgi:hypothetical protein